MQDNIYIIRSEADYEAAMAEYEALFDNEENLSAADGDRFELLGLLIAKYEEEQSSMRASDPVEMILFTMDRLGLGQPDLAHLLGSRSRASEILNRRRELSLPQIKTLHKAWGIPADALISDSVYA